MDVFLAGVHISSCFSLEFLIDIINLNGIDYNKNVAKQYT